MHRCSVPVIARLASAARRFSATPRVLAAESGGAASSTISGNATENHPSEIVSVNPEQAKPHHPAHQVADHPEGRPPAKFGYGLMSATSDLDAAHYARSSQIRQDVDSAVGKSPKTLVNRESWYESADDLASRGKVRNVDLYTFKPSGRAIDAPTAIGVTRASRDGSAAFNVTAKSVDANNDARTEADKSQKGMLGESLYNNSWTYGYYRQGQPSSNNDVTTNRSSASS